MLAESFRLKWCYFLRVSSESCRRIKSSWFGSEKGYWTPWWWACFTNYLSPTKENDTAPKLCLSKPTCDKVGPNSSFTLTDQEQKKAPLVSCDDSLMHNCINAEKRRKNVAYWISFKEKTWRTISTVVVFRDLEGLCLVR